MMAVLTFNPHAATHQWATLIYDDQGEYVMGLAIDAATEEEAREKVKWWMAD